MTGWRLILGAGDGAGLGAATGARNMAVDHALHEAVQAGARPVLRLYCWDPPCLSLGRNQHAAGLYDPARAAAAGIDVVRRPTGGLAVLHDRELTYCVLAPVALLGGPRAAYARISRALVEGLRASGVAAAVSGSGAPRSPLGDAAEPCFEAPAPGEVVASGRKLVGSAQRCENGTLLQHGSILLGGSQERVRHLQQADRAAARMAAAMPTVPAASPSGTTPAAPAASPSGTTPAAQAAWLSGTAAAAPTAGAVTLCELLGTEPTAHEIAVPIAAGFETVFGTALAPDSLSREEHARADELEAWYGAASWTWRR